MEVELEESVWSKYPEELHMAILKRLPWMDKLRLRRVCVLWNSILRDPSLLKCSRSPTGSSPFCCLLPNNRLGEYQLYSPLGRNWRPFYSNLKVIGAAAGLLLMEGGTNGKRTLFLMNPLNRSRRQLPLPEELENIALYQICIFDMTMDRDTDTLRILAGVWHGHVSDDENVRNLHLRHWHRWKFHVYSLDSNSWKLVADLRMRDEGYPICTLVEQLPSVTLLGADLYLLSTFHGTSSHLYKIKPTHPPSRYTNLGLEEDLVIGGDSGAQLPPSSSYVDSTLFGIDGRLMLILRQKFRLGKADDFLSNLWQLSMYEFDFSSSEWKVGLEMPSQLARSRSFVTFDVGAGFVCFHNDEFTGMCNITCNTWTMLPPPVVKSKSSRSPVTKIYLFEPRLDIIL